MAASLVLLNGRLWSPDGAGAGRDAIVVGDGRIAAVTSSAEARAMAGPATRVIDLKGRLAIPAFGDAHVHPVGGGLESLRCNLAGARDRTGYLGIIAEYARGLGPDEWVLGGGWSMEAFPGGVPAAADLVAAAGGRPVFLPNRDHHSAWVSPAALARAGINRETADPADGRIERDERGEPTGTLHDGAMRLAARIVPAPSAADLAAGLRAGLRHLHTLGITHWQDAIVGEAPDLGMPDAYATYRTAASEGWLTAHVNGALWWDRARGTSQLADLLARREHAASGRFRATSVKIMMDGVCETLTAAMTEPYADRPAGHEHRGRLFVQPDEVDEAVRLLSQEGFQVHFHALGDRAVHVALDALAHVRAEPARAAGPRVRLARPAVPGTSATIWPTCSSSGPAIWTGSANSARWPPSSRCGPATTRRWTTSRCPWSARNAPAGSTGSGPWPSVAPGSRSAATGRCRARTPCSRSTSRSTGGCRRGSAGQAQPKPASRSCLTRPSLPVRPSPRSPPVSPTSTTARQTSARCGPAAWPTSRCSTVTFSRSRRARSAPPGSA